jgi:hypothetical protein
MQICAFAGADGGVCEIRHHFLSNAAFLILYASDCNMNETITKVRAVFSDTIKTENDIFKRNVTSKEERGVGGVREVTCNSSCHPQDEGLWV